MTALTESIDVMDLVKHAAWSALALGMPVDVSFNADVGEARRKI
jgi:hypothetical protein